VLLAVVRATLAAQAGRRPRRPLPRLPLPPFSIPVCCPPIGGTPSSRPFIKDVHSVAFAHGVSAEYYYRAVDGIAPVASIAEANLTSRDFRVRSALSRGAVSALRVEDAKAMLADQVDVLAAIQAITSTRIPRPPPGTSAIVSAGVRRRHETRSRLRGRIVADEHGP